MINANAHWLQEYFTKVPDFPEKGVLFHWCGPLLRDPAAFEKAIDEMAQHYKVRHIDVIMALEARGFVFGAALALKLKVPLALARKTKKLPGKLISVDYNKEYGIDRLEIEDCALKPGDHVLIIDDVLATGGTALAAAQLVEKAKAHVVEIACLLELPGLKGREKIKCPIFSLMKTV